MTKGRWNGAPGGLEPLLLRTKFTAMLRLSRDLKIDTHEDGVACSVSPVFLDASGLGIVVHVLSYPSSRSAGTSVSWTTTRV
jgi:hypothetical protein